ncbi:MAG: hypothetical protein LBR34_03570 [Prevotella sp.]|jgi:nucleoid-associated protein YgaU|nr:hypothetical protein [Prevotella sp.]
MKEKRNLYYVADKVAAQTKLDSTVARHFVNQLFKEIEKGVIVSSVVKIDNFGIFRTIKSMAAERLLFLEKFESTASRPKPEEPAIKPAEPALPPEAAAAVDTEAEPGRDAEPDAFAAGKTYHPAESPVVLPRSATIDYTDAASFSDEKKKKFSKRLKIFFLFLITTVAVIYVIEFLHTYPKKKNDAVNQHKVSYREVENADTIHFSHVIVVGPNMDFLSLSKVYYNDEMFWPYIYKANESAVADSFGSFEIQEGTVIKIPRLDKDLIDHNNPSSVDKAKSLVNEIMRLKNRSDDGDAPV